MKTEKAMKTIWIKTYDAPCGKLVLGDLDGKLCLCNWMNKKQGDAVNRRLCKGLQAEMKMGTSAVIEQAISELEAYFKGERKTFDVPLLFCGTTFQQTVWNELLKIPYGTTCSYALLAERIGQTKAVRAVANANRMNALSIFVPCHRVIGSNGTLTGYAGGLPAKEMLLHTEGISVGGKRGRLFDE